MEPVRVALVGMPALLGDIVRAVIDTEPGLRAVDAAGDIADVVVCTAGSRVGDEVIVPLLHRRSAARVVIIAADGRCAYVCTPSGELSPATLRDAILGQR